MANIATAKIRTPSNIVLNINSICAKELMTSETMAW